MKQIIQNNIFLSLEDLKRRTPRTPDSQDPRLQGILCYFIKEYQKGPQQAENTFLFKAI